MYLFILKTESFYVTSAVLKRVKRSVCLKSYRDPFASAPLVLGVNHTLYFDMLLRLENRHESNLISNAHANLTNILNLIFLFGSFPYILETGSVFLQACSAII